MNDMPLREKAVLAVFGIVIAFALLVGFWFLSQGQEWKVASDRYRAKVREHKNRLALIGRRLQIEEECEQAKGEMPLIAEDDSPDRIWGLRLDEIAASNHVAILKRTPGKEKEQDSGDVYEMEIVVNRWEASLESLVHFMYEIENAQGAMFHFPALTINPIPKKAGYYSGSFTVNCIYMKGEPK